MPTITKKSTKKTNNKKQSSKNTKGAKETKNTTISKKSKKNTVVQEGGNSCGPKKSQPLRPRLYNKAQSSNILADYPNAPPFPPDFLDECSIM